MKWLGFERQQVENKLQTVLPCIDGHKLLILFMIS